MPLLPGFRGSQSQSASSTTSPRGGTDGADKPEKPRRRMLMGTKESNVSQVSFASSGAEIVHFDSDAEHEIEAPQRGSSSKRGPQSRGSKDSSGHISYGSRKKMSTKDSTARSIRSHGSQSPPGGSRRYKHTSKESQGSLLSSGSAHDSGHGSGHGSGPMAGESRRYKRSSKESMGSQGSLSSLGSRSGKHSAGRSSPSSPGRSRYTTKDTAGTKESGLSSEVSGTGSSGSEGTRERRRKKRHKKGGSKAERSRTRSRSRSTKGSHSRSGTSGSSGSGSWSSSSSEDLAEEDLSGMDQSILPLHLRGEGAIRSKEEAFQYARESRKQKNTQISGFVEDRSEEEKEEEEEDFEWQDQRSRLQILLSRFLGHEEGTAHDIHYLHKESIHMYQWQFAVRVYPCAAWSFVVMCLLFLFVVRFYTSIEPEGQRVVLLKRVLQAEVKVAASLAPALRIASSLAFAARSGMINASTPYTSIANILAPELNMAPSVQFVQVVGSTGSMTRPAVLRPNTIHDERLPTADRYPLVFASAKSCERAKKDPVSCFRLNNSALIDMPRDGAALRWQRPSFLTYDGSVPYWLYENERVNVLIDLETVNIFAHRLIAYINATNASRGQGPQIAVEVALELSNTFAAVVSTAPEGGATYLCTTDGTVLAGSDWVPAVSAMYDQAQGIVTYPNLWDLGMPWTASLTKEMLASRRHGESLSATNLVVARPVAIGDPDGASYRLGLADLRIVSMAPRAVGASKDLKALVHAAIGIMGAPGVFLLLALVALAVRAVIMTSAQWLFEHWH